MAKMTNLDLEKIKGDYTYETNNQGSSDIYQDSIKKALDDQNYKSYFDQILQAYNVKKNTEKYLNNELAAQGFNTQGYGTSANIGVQNAAMNTYNDLFKNYNANKLQIESDAQQRLENKNAELDNQLVTFITNSDGTDTSINKILANYGYMDEDGNYTDKWNNLSDESKGYISSAITNVKGSGGTIYDNFISDNQLKGMDIESLRYSSYDGSSKTLSSNIVNEEINLMQRLIDSGLQKNGTAFELTNGKDDNIKAYVLYYNGAYYRLTADEYANLNTNKVHLKGGKIVTD